MPRIGAGGIEACGALENRRLHSMLKVTKKAVALLKAVKSAEAAADETGIRIQRGVRSRESGTVDIGFALSDGPETGDAEIEQDGLRIFLENELVKPLDGRTLDVRSDPKDGPELIFR